MHAAALAKKAAAKAEGARVVTAVGLEAATDSSSGQSLTKATTGTPTDTPAKASGLGGQFDGLEICHIISLLAFIYFLQMNCRWSVWAPIFESSMAIVKACVSRTENNRFARDAAPRHIKFTMCRGGGARKTSFIMELCFASQRLQSK